MKRFDLKRAFGGGGNSVNPSGDEVLGRYSHSEGDGGFMPEESHKREDIKVLRYTEYDVKEYEVSKSKCKSAFTFAEGATHVANSNNSRKVAFTLAETLITLGIIGVVAALTIPVLISGYKKHIVEVKLERFYSNMNQAISLSEIDNGNLEEWPVKFKDYMDSSYTFWEVYLSKYFKSVKSVKKGIVSTSVILIDGSSFNIGTGDCVDIYYFLNSNDMNKVKSSLISGKDYFSFRICANSTGYYSGGKKGFFSASNGSLEQRNDRAFLLEHCQHPFEAGDGDTCTALIQYDGWKIKGDYPIKF